MLVRKTPSNIITGVTDIRGNYLMDGTMSTLNATEGFTVTLVLAWGTRFAAALMVSDIGNGMANSPPK